MPAVDLERHCQQSSLSVQMIYLINLDLLKGCNLSKWYLIIAFMRMNKALMIWSDLILETLKDELSLLIFVLPNPIFSLEFIVLHRLRIVEIYILRVEHMGTEIQHSPLVDLCRLIFRSVDLRIVLDKVTYALNKATVLLLHLKILFFWQVR